MLDKPITRWFMTSNRPSDQVFDLLMPTAKARCRLMSFSHDFVRDLHARMFGPV